MKKIIFILFVLISINMVLAYDSCQKNVGWGYPGTYYEHMYADAHVERCSDGDRTIKSVVCEEDWQLNTNGQCVKRFLSECRMSMSDCYDPCGDSYDGCKCSNYKWSCDGLQCCTEGALGWKGYCGASDGCKGCGCCWSRTDEAILCGQSMAGGTGDTIDLDGTTSGGPEGINTGCPSSDKWRDYCHTDDTRLHDCWCCYWIPYREHLDTLTDEVANIYFDPNSPSGGKVNLNDLGTTHGNLSSDRGNELKITSLTHPTSDLQTEHGELVRGAGNDDYVTNDYFAQEVDNKDYCLMYFTCDPFEGWVNYEYDGCAQNCIEGSCMEGICLSDDDICYHHIICKQTGTNIEGWIGDEENEYSLYYFFKTLVDAPWFWGEEQPNSGGFKPRYKGKDSLPFPGIPPIVFPEEVIYDDSTGATNPNVKMWTINSNKLTNIPAWKHYDASSPSGYYFYRSSGRTPDAPAWCPESFIGTDLESCYYGTRTCSSDDLRPFIGTVVGSDDFLTKPKEEFRYCSYSHVTNKIQAEFRGSLDEYFWPKCDMRTEPENDDFLTNLSFNWPAGRMFFCLVKDEEEPVNDVCISRIKCTENGWEGVKQFCPEPCADEICYDGLEACWTGSSQKGRYVKLDEGDCVEETYPRYCFYSLDVKCDDPEKSLCTKECIERLPEEGEGGGKCVFPSDEKCSEVGCTVNTGVIFSPAWRCSSTTGPMIAIDMASQSSVSISSFPSKIGFGFRGKDFIGAEPVVPLEGCYPECGCIATLCNYFKRIIEPDTLQDLFPPCYIAATGECIGPGVVQEPRCARLFYNEMQHTMGGEYYRRYCYENYMFHANNKINNDFLDRVVNLNNYKGSPIPDSLSSYNKEYQGKIENYCPPKKWLDNDDEQMKELFKKPEPDKIVPDQGCINGKNCEYKLVHTYKFMFNISTLIDTLVFILSDKMVPAQIRSVDFEDDKHFEHYDLIFPYFTFKNRMWAYNDSVKQGGEYETSLPDCSVHTIQGDCISPCIWEESCTGPDGNDCSSFSFEDCDTYGLYGCSWNADMSPAVCAGTYDCSGMEQPLCVDASNPCTWGKCSEHAILKDIGIPSDSGVLEFKGESINYHWDLSDYMGETFFIKTSLSTEQSLEGRCTDYPLETECVGGCTDGTLGPTFNCGDVPPAKLAECVSSGCSLACDGGIFACSGITGANAQSLCTTGVGCTWDGCTGSIDCSGFGTDQALCENYGCTWGGTSCSAGTPSCSSITIGTYCTDIHCDWDGSICSGSHDCSAITGANAQSLCTNVHCTWVGCTGPNINCDSLDPAICSSYGCTILCDGTSDCSEITDLSICTDVGCTAYESYGCSWSECYECSSIIDSSLCTNPCTWGGGCTGTFICSDIEKMEECNTHQACSWHDAELECTSYFRTTGKQGYAINFDGIDDYVEVPDSDGLNFMEFTVMAWVKPEDMDAWAILIGKNLFEGVSSSEKRGWMIVRNDVNDEIFLDMFGSDGSEKASLPISYIAGEWIHIAFTYKKDPSIEDIRAYGNGNGVEVLPAVEVGDWTFSNSDQPLRIGRGHSPWYFKGVIDEVRIYDRALSSQEILDIYTLGFIENDDYISYWKFDENSGTSVVSVGDTDDTYKGTLNGVTLEADCTDYDKTLCASPCEWQGCTGEPSCGFFGIDECDPIPGCGWKDGECKGKPDCFSITDETDVLEDTNCYKAECAFLEGSGNCFGDIKKSINLQYSFDGSTWIPSLPSLPIEIIPRNANHLTDEIVDLGCFEINDITELSDRQNECENKQELGCSWDTGKEKCTGALGIKIQAEQDLYVTLSPQDKNDELYMDKIGLWTKGDLYKLKEKESYALRFFVNRDENENKISFNPNEMIISPTGEEIPPPFVFDSYNISLFLNNEKVCFVEKKWSIPYLYEDEPQCSYRQDDNDWLTCAIPDYNLLEGEDKELMAQLCFEVPQYFLDNCDVSYLVYAVNPPVIQTPITAFPKNNKIKSIAKIRENHLAELFIKYKKQDGTYFKNPSNPDQDFENTIDLAYCSGLKTKVCTLENICPLKVLMQDYEVPDPTTPLVDSFTPELNASDIFDLSDTASIGFACKGCTGNTHCTGLEQCMYENYIPALYTSTCNTDGHICVPSAGGNPVDCCVDDDCTQTQECKFIPQNYPQCASTYTCDYNWQNIQNYDASGFCYQSCTGGWCRDGSCSTSLTEDIDALCGDNLDNDCDNSIDCADVNCDGKKCGADVCVGRKTQEKKCVGGSCTTQTAVCIVGSCNALCEDDTDCTSAYAPHCDSTTCLCTS